MVFYKEYNKLSTFYLRYLILKRIFLSNFLRLELPYKLTFALTYKCNLRCKTCFIWKKEQKDELSTYEIEQFFKRSNLFSWIDLTGGEIFLRKDLLEILEIIFRYCRQLCILHFPTNGYLTEKIIGTVKEICTHRRDIVLIITVSMDGPEEINNEIKGDKDAWIRSLETFIELKNIGLKFVYLGYTLSKYNSGSLKHMLYEVRKYYQDINYNDIHINIAHKSEHYFNNTLLDLTSEITVTEDMLNIQKIKNTSVKNFLERSYLKLASSYLSLQQIPIRCQALASTCFIDPYGDIYPCIIYKRKISNIFDINYDFYKFWNEANTIILRKELLNKKCNGCWTPCEAYPAILGSIFKDSCFNKIILRKKLLF